MRMLFVLFQIAAVVFLAIFLAIVFLIVYKIRHRKDFSEYDSMTQAQVVDLYKVSGRRSAGEKPWFYPVVSFMTDKSVVTARSKIGCRKRQCPKKGDAVMIIYCSESPLDCAVISGKKIPRRYVLPGVLEYDKKRSD